MRLNLPGRRLARRTGGLIVALSVVAAAASPALGQASKAKPPAPTPADTRPLGRYIPKENLVIYIESSGLDAHPDAWKKTAAYKLLNETKLGVMLELMAAQLLDKGLALAPSSKITGADAVATVKMLAQRGFAFGARVDPKGTGIKALDLTLVVRTAAAKEYRPQFARLVGTFMAGSKAQAVKKGTRSVVSVAGKSNTWTWWAEGNDVVFDLGSPEEIDPILDTLDGKRPSAVEHPMRVELARDESGFVPVGLLFFDPSAGTSINASYQELMKTIQAKLTRLDFRWGFQDEALMTVTQIKSPKPRTGFMRVFEPPPFEKGKLPPLPEGMETFAVLSVEPPYVLDVLTGLTPKGGAPNQIADLVESLKTKSRIDLRKDLLAHLGPTMVLYSTPGTATALVRPSGDAAKGTAAPAGLGGLPGLSALSSLGLGGTQAIPKFTLVAEVKNPDAFAKALDNLMIAVNRQLREQAAEAAEAIEKAVKTAKGPDANEDPAAASGRGRGPATRRTAASESAHFKMMPGKENERIYMLQIPNTSAQKLPAGIKPTIRLGDKYVAISTTPDAARAALEVKPGEWTVPNDLAAAFDQLPKALIYLGVSDPRATNPEILASLPGVLQTVINTASTMGQARANLAAAGSLNGPGGMPGTAPADGGTSSRPPGGSRSSAPTLPGSAPGLQSGYPGASMPGMPGMPGAGAPPAAGAAGAATGEPLQFNIDADKLPKAEELRSRMFPAVFAISSDDQEVKIITRSSFPDVVAVGAGGGVATALLFPAVQAARLAAVKAAGKTAATTPPEGPGSRPPGSPGPGAPGALPGSPPSGALSRPNRK